MISADSFDPDLVRRHDRHGPRYTSYPTAAQFHTGFSASDYRRAALLSNAAPAKPLSIYVHVPFCASPCFYCGCHKIITRDRRQSTDYLRRLLIEIELQATLFDRHRRVQQLHFGGGTPTFLSIDELAQIVNALSERFTLERSAHREFSIEIDPRTVTAETFPGLARLGFNRLSFGIQDFDPHVQAAVNRRQSPAEVDAALSQARTAGFRSISFDLIYGLPLQTIASFSQTLDSVIAMRPDRIAAYGYAHLPQRFSAQRAIDAQQLPDAELRLQLLALTVRQLTAAGYRHIGMDHFALPHDDLVLAASNGDLHRNFQGYSTGAGCDLIGLGASAISSVGGTYAQNFKTIAAYARALDDRQLPIERGIALAIDDRLRAAAIQQLMCARKLSFRELENAYAIDFAEYFAAELRELKRLQRDGLLHLDDAGISVSTRGGFLLRSIAMVFDKYLRADHAATYSKVV